MSLASHFQVRLVRPTADEFLALRAKVGWQVIRVSEAETSLINSLFHVVIYDDSQAVGMGRVIGDGRYQFY